MNDKVHISFFRRLSSLGMCFTVLVALGVNVFASLSDLESVLDFDRGIVRFLDFSESDHVSFDGIVTDEKVAVQSVTFLKDFDDNDFDCWGRVESSMLWKLSFFDPATTNSRSAVIEQVKLFILYSSPKLPSFS